MRLRILSTLLALVLAAPPAIAGVMLHYCRMMDQVSAKCCCCEGEQAEAPTLAIKSLPCCDVTENAGTVIPATAGTRAAKVAPPSWIWAPTPALVTAPKRATRLDKPAARAPPNAGPKRFLRHCSFLI